MSIVILACLAPACALLTQLRAFCALCVAQGRQEGIGGGSQTALEEALVAEEFVALPQTGALVFPLTDNGLLVGILVIDSPQQSQWSKPAAGTEAAALGSAAALPAPTDPQHSSSVSVHHISRLEGAQLERMP